MKLKEALFPNFHVCISSVLQLNVFAHLLVRYRMKDGIFGPVFVLVLSMYVSELELCIEIDLVTTIGTGCCWHYSLRICQLYKQQCQL